MYNKLWYKLYREKNGEKLRLASREWYSKNKKEIRARRDAKKHLAREWYENYKSRRNSLYKIKRKNDYQFYIIEKLRYRIRYLIIGKGDQFSRDNILGISIYEFKIWIESQFYGGMDWDNYGKIWSLDHVYPCSLFDLRHEYEQKICFHWFNYQPILIKENIRKNNKLYI